MVEQQKFWGEMVKGPKTPAFIISGCLIGFGAYGLLHTYGIDRYQKWMQMYHKGKPRKLEDRLQLMAFEVLDEMKIPARFKMKQSVQFKEAPIRFFPVIGPEIWSAGSVNLVRGGIIGIPYCYTYDSTDDIDTSEVIVASYSPRDKERKFVSWDADPAKELLESLVLSERSKRFGIAREIHVVNSYKRLAVPATISTLTVLLYSAGAYIAHRYKIKKRILPVRMTVYTIYTSLVLAAMYALYQKMLKHYDIQVDHRAIDTNFEFYQPAAIEYYEKLLRRNRALLEINPEKYAGKISPEGDPMRPWNNSLPLTERLKRIKEMKPDHITT